MHMCRCTCCWSGRESHCNVSAMTDATECFALGTGLACGRICIACCSMLVILSNPMVTSVFWCQVRRHSAALRVALVLHSAARMDPFAEDGNEGMEQSPASPDADMLESEMLSWESTFENMPVMLPAHDETGMSEMSSPGASSSGCSPSARTSSSASAAESFSPAAGMSLPVLASPGQVVMPARKKTSIDRQARTRRIQHEQLALQPGGFIRAVEDVQELQKAIRQLSTQI